MSEDPKLALVEGVIKLSERITPKTTFNFLLACISGAVGWHILKDSDTVIPALLANQFIVVCSAAGIALGLAGFALKAVADKLSSQTEKIEAQMGKRINDAEDALADYKAEMGDYKAEMRLELKRMRDAEARCQRTLARVEAVLREHKIALPPNTGWGDL